MHAGFLTLFPYHFSCVLLWNVVCGSDRVVGDSSYCEIVQCESPCRRSIVQCEHSSDWMLPQIVVQCENNGDQMTLKIMQCELGSRVIVLLEGEPSAQSEVLNALDWVFIKAISIFWCIELFFYSDESLSPCRWKTAPQHEAATSTLYFWDGTLQVMSRAGFLQTWCLELRFIRPENLVSQSLRVLWVLFCKFQVCFHVSSLRRGLSLATLT